MNLALQMVESLKEKLPKVFSKVFIREGVMHAARELISLKLGDVSERSKAFMEKYCHGDFSLVETSGSEDFLHLRNLYLRLNAMLEASKASSWICLRLNAMLERHSLRKLYWRYFKNLSTNILTWAIRPHKQCTCNIDLRLLND